MGSPASAFVWIHAALGVATLALLAAVAYRVTVVVTERRNESS